MLESVLAASCAVILYQNSFLAPLVLRFVPWNWARDLFTCPLCLGFHVGWISAFGFSWQCLAHGFMVAVTALVISQILGLLRNASEYFGLRSNQILRGTNETSID